MENIKLYDKVIIIESNGFNLSKDDIGTVTEIDKESSLRVTVKGKHNFANWISSKCVKLIEDGNNSN